MARKQIMQQNHIRLSRNAPRDYVDIPSGNLPQMKHVRTFMKMAVRRANRSGCMVRGEMTNYGNVTVEFACPTSGKLIVLKRDLRKGVKAASRLQGIKRRRR